MSTISYDITINKPVDQVFGYLIDAANHKTWQAGILDVKVTPDGPVGIGSVYHYTTQVMGRKMETQLQVSAFEPNKKWSVKTIGVPTSVETSYIFESAGNATKLTLSMDMAGGFPAAAEAMVKSQIQKTLADQGNNIKKTLEN
jgi:uncharacterized protein YndB with AHSA1/START domain